MHPSSAPPGTTSLGGGMSIPQSQVDPGSLPPQSMPQSRQGFSPGVCVCVCACVCVCMCGVRACACHACGSISTDGPRVCWGETYVVL